MDEPLRIGDWRFISQLGTGSFGVVSLWRNEVDNECIAVKKCKHINGLTKKQQERWETEVLILQKANHSNIINFKLLPDILDKELNKYNPSGLPLLSMEYCSGGNLRYALQLPQNSCGLTENAIRNILNDITSAVFYLHKIGIAHRDIKPENIVLTGPSDFTTNRITYKLIDLGYAKEINTICSFVGTVMYLAPEIFLNKKYNLNVDYWSLGVLAFEIICGTFPFYPHNSAFEMFRNIKNKNADVIYIYKNEKGNLQHSQELKRENRISSCFKPMIQNWIRGCLQYNPDIRGHYDSGNNVFNELKHILNKVIITVYFFSKMEYYSYEINDYTFVSTLKSWICRDIRLKDTDLIVINAANYREEEDSKIVMHVINNCENGVTFYIFKKDCILNIPKSMNIPRNVQAIFSSDLMGRDLKCAFSHALFYISEEVKLMNAMYCGAYQLVQCTNVIHVKLFKNIKIIRLLKYKLLVQLKCYSNMNLKHIHCCYIIKNYKILIDVCEKYEKLVYLVQKFINSSKKLMKRFRRIQLFNDILKKGSKRAFAVFEDNDLKYLYREAETLFLKMSPENNSNSLRNLREILSNVIKMKFNILEDNNYREFLKQLICSKKETTKLTLWTDELMKMMNQVSQEIDNIACEYSSLLKNTNNNKNGMKYETVKAEEIILHNRDIRSDIQELLNHILAEHKKNCQELKVWSQ